MESLKLEYEGKICRLTIDRPHARNAVSRSVIRELASAMDDIERVEPNVVVVRGSGDKAFVAGGDIKDFDEIRSLPDAVRMATDMRNVLQRLIDLPCPTVAALNGVALGGGMEMAVACDLRIAADDVRVAFNQVRLGITPAWGGIERLVELVGPGRASYLLFSGCRLTAGEAREYGLIELVVERAMFNDVLEEFLLLLSSAPRPALVSIKSTMNTARNRLDKRLADAAVGGFADSWVAADHWEAVERMQEARPGRT